VTAIEPDLTRQLLAAHHEGAPLVLLFDYDGTLAPIAAHPWLAELPAETRHLLQNLALQPGVYVGILSGRALDELIQMVSLASLYFCGTSGLELDLRGKRFYPPDSAQSARMIDDLARTLQSVAAGAIGAWVELKPLGLTVHYRAVSAALIPGFRDRINRVLHSYGQRIRVISGRSAIEITPNLGWTKGSAVHRIVQDIGPKTFPFFAGDGDNDADAMEAVRALGGLTLGIGSHAPNVAQSFLPDPRGLANFLHTFLENLEVHSSAS
jgi:trehalose-phosphatase